MKNPEMKIINSNIHLLNNCSANVKYIGNM